MAVILDLPKPFSKWRHGLRPPRKLPPVGVVPNWNTNFGHSGKIKAGVDFWRSRIKTYGSVY